MHIYLVSDYHEIKEDNANISRVGAGWLVSLMFYTLAVLYPTGVSYPNPNDENARI